VPINAAIWFKITRWFIANISLSCHTNLNFKGSLLHYLGWQLLLSLPFFTFMGWPLFGHYLGWQLYASISLFNLLSWPWVVASMTRWFCRNIQAGDNQLEFQGGGWDILWRFILACLFTILIIPIPWVYAWFIRWYVSKLAIIKKPIGCSTGTDS
jgi:hypothetical protein